MLTPNIPGTEHMQTLMVDDTLVVPAVSEHFTGFRDMPPVFATAFMVGFIEWACIEAMRPYLEPGEHTVGTRIDVSHTAATPAGMNVTAFVELIEANGRKLTFRVTCRDETDVIGEGVHERVVINPEKFMQRVSAKRAAARRQ
jgi:fluoroacetyl-CoA thioesterase